MSYAVVAFLFVIVVGGLVFFLTTRAAAGSTPASPEPGDDTEAGDTPQHSDADEGAPARPGPVEPGSGRFKQDPVGGEAEGEPTVDTR